MELLVHAAAASSKRDDDRYKRQAKAYGEFDVGQSTTLQKAESVIPRHASSREPDVRSTLSEDLITSSWNSSLFLADTQLARTALESQLLTSSLKRDQHFLDLDSECSAQDRSVELDGTQAYLAYPASNTRTSPVSLKRRASPASVIASEKRQRVSSPRPGPLPGIAAQELGYTRPRSSSEAFLSTPSKDGGNKSSLGQSASVSTSGDDIPSQLPSTYDLSQVSYNASVQGDRSHRASYGMNAMVTPLGKSSNRHPQSASRRTSMAFPSLPSIPQRRHGVLSPERVLKNGGCNRTALSIIEQPIAPVPLFTQRYVEDTTELDHGEAPETSPAISRVDDSNRLTVAGRKDVQDVFTVHRKPPLSPAYVSSPSNISHEMARVEPRSSAQSRSSPTNLRLGVITGLSGLRRAESAIAMPPPPRPLPDVLIPVPTTPARLKELETLQSLTLSIYPGMPPTSSELFVSHVTPALDTICKMPHLDRCFDSKRITRPLRQSERGYWLVNSCAWSATLQISFWVFLRKWVGSGDSGWGVWCTRGPDHQRGDGSAEGKSERKEDSMPSLGIIRVSCWGEVVQHVYHLIYVASKSKLRKQQIAWYDADGEVVVQMEAVG